MHEVLELLLLWCCWVILWLQNLSATLITLGDLFGRSSLLKLVLELRDEFRLAVCDRQLSLHFAVCFASVNMGKGGVAATFCEILIAILLPPLGVFLKYACGIEFWICLLLTILGYIPGILYALYVIVM